MCFIMQSGIRTFIFCANTTVIKEAPDIVHQHIKCRTSPNCCLKVGSTLLPKISLVWCSINMESQIDTKCVSSVCTSGHVVYPTCNWNCLLASAVPYFPLDNIFLFPLLQIYPYPQVQKADRADQRGEVDPQFRQHVRLIHSHELQDRFNPNCRPVAFRLKRICEIYSKVLGSNEALHVSLDAD